MSPDDIFAAQMWPWPDPLIKRDATGRILFLNFAFLNIYGGRIEDWQGNIVSGWPTPQGGATPTRFETRIPSVQGEVIYDWIEYTLADGHALAIARDVTAFATPPTPPSGLPEHMPATDQAQSFNSNTPPLQTETVLAPEADQLQPAQQDVPYQAQQHAPQDMHPAAEIQAQPLSAPQTPNPASIAAPLAAVPLAHIASANMASPDTQNQHDMGTPANPAAPLDAIMDKGPQDFSEAEPIPAPANPEPVAPHAQEIPPATDIQSPAPAAETYAENTPENPTTERDYERRALPIENDDAVLGNNWRDAVIAKAVGKSEDSAQADLEDTQADEEEVTQESIQGDDGAYRILLAEDNAINALLTRTLLEAEGCIVEVVEDGALAVEAVKNNVYDMIFMDMRMPNMDGLEATRKIRALDHRSKSLPIVALTANAFDDDRNACFDSGMNDFMTKPVSTEELSEMVKTWMKNRDQRLAS